MDPLSEQLVKVFQHLGNQFQSQEESKEEPEERLIRIIEEVAKLAQTGRVIIKQEFLYFTWYRSGSLNNEIISYNLERGVQRI